MATVGVCLESDALYVAGVSVAPFAGERRPQSNTVAALVVVIVILGILASAAVPKFITMRVDARRASISSLYGSVRNASVLTRAQVLVQGQMAADFIGLTGSTVTLVNGYPSAEGIISVLDLQGFRANPVGNTTTFTIYGYNGTNCEVTYKQAPAQGDSPVITMDNSGCG